MQYVLEDARYIIDLPEFELSGLTSLHGLVRTMQRFNVTQHKALRLIKEAFYKGHKVEELPKRWQRDYVENERMLAYNGWTKLRVFKNFLFIFSGEDKLITMYKLPRSFDKPCYFDKNKQHVRCLRKYRRMNPLVV